MIDTSTDCVAFANIYHSALWIAVTHWLDALAAEPERIAVVSDVAHPLDLLVRRLSTHAAVDAGARAEILGLPHIIRRFDSGAYLVREGDRPKVCAVLVEGYAMRQKLAGDGGRQFVSLHIPGDPLDLQNLFLHTADHSVITVGRATMAIIPRDAVQELARFSAPFSNAVITNLLVEASIQREWTLNVGRRGGLARVAHLLCEFAVRLDAQGLTSGDCYQLPLSQEQLADALGLTAVHVNRMLKQLDGAGLIVRDGRTISFPRGAALRSLADFNARYLHLDKRG